MCSTGGPQKQSSLVGCGCDVFMSILVPRMENDFFLCVVSFWGDGIEGESLEECIPAVRLFVNRPFFHSFVSEPDRQRLPRIFSMFCGLQGWSP